MNSLFQQCDELPMKEKSQLLHKLLASITNLEDNAPDSEVQEAPIINPADADAKSSKAAGSKKRKCPNDYEDYPDELRKEAVNLARQYNNNRKACREILEKYKTQNVYQNLTEKSIRDWRNTPVYIANYDYDKAHKGRVQLRDNTGKFADMEQILIREIKKMRADAKPVSRDWIMARALDLAADPSFKASDGWFSNFSKRAKISFRVSTKVMQKLSEDYTTLVLEFMENIRQQRMNYEVKNKLKIIYGNVDQVPFEFDMATGKTYDFTGAREVRLVQTTGVKQRFTVQLCILSDGTFLPPIFVFKSKGAIPEALHSKFKDKALIYCNKNGWVTEGIMLDFISKIWLNLNINKDTHKLFLILDKFSVHKKATLQTRLKDAGSLFEYVPAGCTGLLQPLDTDINKPLKDRVRSRYKDWYDTKGTKPENTTKGGYLRPPSSELIIQMVLNACAEIPEISVCNAFKHCGINNDLYGSENNILCSKLKTKSEIQQYLSEKFSKKSYDPYKDTDEIDAKIISAKDSTTYDIIVDDPEMEGVKDTVGYSLENPVDNLETDEYDDELMHDPFSEEELTLLDSMSNLTSILSSSEVKLFKNPISQVGQEEPKILPVPKQTKKKTHVEAGQKAITLFLKKK